MKHEKANDLDGAVGAPGNGGIRHHRRRHSDALVELAGAGVVRITANCVLAGARSTRVVPDSVWRLWLWWRLSSQFASPNGRANTRASARANVRTLGTDDAGGAREIPPGHGRRLRLRALQPREQRNESPELIVTEH